MVRRLSKRARRDHNWPIRSALLSDDRLRPKQERPIDLDPLYLEFEKAIAEVGAETVDFLLSLDPNEIQLLYARSAEAIPHRRSETPR